MNRRRLMELSALSLLSAQCLSACARNVTTLRYRLKIVVKVDGQLHDGSSVIEAEFADRGHSSWLPPEAGRFATRSWGEAIAVDLRERGFLFGLLFPPQGYDGFSVKSSLDVLSRSRFGNQRPTLDNLLESLRGIEGEFTLGESDQPALVRFRDITEPSTVERVDLRRFSTTYGAAASFVQATISITQDPTTTGLKRRLPWLATSELAKRGSTLVGQLSPGFHPIAQMSMAERLDVHNFVRNGD